MLKSQDLWKWPEFIALAKRLGIPIDKPITQLSIHLGKQNLVSYDIKILGEDDDLKKFVTTEEGE